MDRSKNQILAEVPDTVQYMDVVCLNSTFPFAAVYAPWDQVKGFLNGVVSAKDLKSTISVRDIP
jgi:hypothetical protein